MRSSPLDWEAAGAVLFTEGLPAQTLPVCDHYAGNDKFYRKALELRLQLGDCFDITLDLEDGATVGQEQSASQWAGQCVHRHVEQFGENSLRPGVRIHPMQHLSFEQDLEHLLRHNQHPPQYLMLPKPQGLSDVNAAWESISHRCNQEDVAAPALHVLIETHGALDEVKSIAALPFVQSLSFGIMDYVSSFRGAIPKSALNSPDQFDHPLVRQAKLEISKACHQHGKTPSHSVCRNIRNTQSAAQDALRAKHELGYTRMWSIHPTQVAPIVSVLSPTSEELTEAMAVLLAAQEAQWGPIQLNGELHDRASYRYFWELLNAKRLTPHSA